MKPTSPPRNLIHVGCAGWAIRTEQAEEFPGPGTHLARYAGRLPAVEINSSFYKPHRPNTYARWAASVPEPFRFAVKVPRDVTHHRRLVATEAALDRFLSEVKSLAKKLGPVLIQLPPSLAFDAAVVEAFFTTLRERFDGAVVLEPRHPTWFTSEASGLMTTFRVSRVAADPAVVPQAAEPGGWNGIAYYRLHGSPKMYYSAYSEAYLEALARKLLSTARTSNVWCIFDNTAEGAATTNALGLLRRLQAPE